MDATILNTLRRTRSPGLVLCGMLPRSAAKSGRLFMAAGICSIIAEASSEPCMT